MFLKGTEATKMFTKILNSEGVSEKDFETYLKTSYQLEVNPLPPLRTWLKRNKLDIKVNYFERNGDEIKEKAKSFKLPAIVVQVVKGNCGEVSDVILHKFEPKKNEKREEIDTE